MNQAHLKAQLITLYLLCTAGFAQANNHENDQNLDSHHLELLAKQGDISAQYELGVMYAEGRNVDKNLSKAKNYLDQVINNQNKSDFAFIDVAKIYWEMFELWKH
ncbi:MAG: SEL1-like repeat protein [Candidatus Thioglobus sp.]|jgi:TPR repeat protein